MSVGSTDFDTWEPIDVLSAKVRSQKLTAVELVNKAFARIDKAESYSAIISKIEKRARERAKEIDQKAKKGEKLGRLAGVPFIAKDNFLTLGSQTTAASNILRGFEAPYQATAIERLEAEGAICVAKANLDAFAHGSSTENSDFFTTKNPHDKTKVPGGSSGGSAASVVLGLAPFALGTDTGGSVRLPASFCGVVGYKPTYGLVSRSGVVAMASSTDVVGPIAKTVSEVALILDVMAGQDPLDSTTIKRDNAPYTKLEGGLRGKKIGIIKEYFASGLDLQVREVIEAGIDKLKAAGAELVEVSLPSLPLALAVYYIVVPAELSSNLSRYDGQQFGFSDQSAKNLNDSFELSRSGGFGMEAKRRIMIGTYVLSSGYYDAYYKKAQTVRTKIINEYETVFKKVDLLVGPTAPSVAFDIGSAIDDPLKMYLTDIMTVAANLSGVPAISIPCGFVGKLPVGLQLVAAQKKDRALLAAAQAFERTNS